MLVGSQYLYSNPLAKVLETTDEEALMAAWPLCEEILPLSRTRALCGTDEPPEKWQDLMNERLQFSPQQAILKVKHKASVNGGRPWATPAATNHQLAAARRSARKQPVEIAQAQLEVQMKLHGGLGAAPQLVMRKLMEVVAGKVRYEIKERQPGERHPGGPVATWAWARSENPAAHPGQVLITVQEEQQVRALIDHCQDRAIQIGGDLVTSELSNDFLLPGA